MNREIINTIKAPAAIGPYSHGNKIFIKNINRVGEDDNE